MAALVCWSRCSHLCGKLCFHRCCCAQWQQLMSHDSDSAVAFTYWTRSPLRLFGFHSDVQCHRAEIWSRLKGGGAGPMGLTQG